jgi:hypothetical protein
MEFAALLELLYSATERSRTVRATVHRVTYQARELDLLRARGMYRDPPLIPPEEGSWGQPAEVFEATTHLWAAHPYWLRWETTFTSDAEGERISIGVKERELFWSRFGDGEIHTNEGRENRGTMTIDEELLLDPSPLLGTYTFEVGGATTFLDRAAWAVVASRRFATQTHAFGRLSDQLSLLVDDERGILLRVAVVVDEEEISHTQVTEVVFDEPVPPDRFCPLR